MPWGRSRWKRVFMTLCNRAPVKNEWGSLWGSFNSINIKMRWEQSSSRATATAAPWKNKKREGNKERRKKGKKGKKGKWSITKASPKKKHLPSACWVLRTRAMLHGQLRTLFHKYTHKYTYAHLSEHKHVPLSWAVTPAWYFFQNTSRQHLEQLRPTIPNYGNFNPSKICFCLWSYILKFTPRV